MITQPAIVTLLAGIAWIGGVGAQQVPAPQPTGSDKSLSKVATAPPERPFLGVIVTENPNSDAGGLVILDQTLNGPASKAGLQVNDILLRMDDQILLLRQQLGLLIKRHQVGDEVTFTYRRDGDDEDRRVDVTLHAAPSPEVTQPDTEIGPEPGLAIENPRVTKRTVRIRDSQHAISITTFQGHPFLTVHRLPKSDVEFEGKVTFESMKKLSRDVQKKVQRVARIKDDQWVFELPPLKPPKQLPPNAGPHSPAPELDQPTLPPAVPPTKPQQ